MFWTLLGNTVTRGCTSPRKLTWFTSWEGGVWGRDYVCTEYASCMQGAYIGVVKDWGGQSLRHELGWEWDYSANFNFPANHEKLALDHIWRPGNETYSWPPDERCTGWLQHQLNHPPTGEHDDIILLKIMQGRIEVWLWKYYRKQYMGVGGYCPGYTNNILHVSC